MRAVRVSTHPDDLGFVTYVRLGQSNRKLTVLFNGQEIKDVITADEEEGFIEKLRVVKNAYVIKGDLVERETLTGEVTIIVPGGGIA